MVESEIHKEEVKNRIFTQRIKRLIQTGQFVPLVQENLEPVVNSKPLSTHIEESQPRENTVEGDHELHNLSKVFSIRKRRTKKVEELRKKADSKTELNLAISASGVDLEQLILDRKVRFLLISCWLMSSAILSKWAKKMNAWWRQFYTREMSNVKIVKNSNNFNNSSSNRTSHSSYNKTYRLSWHFQFEIIRLFRNCSHRQFSSKIPPIMEPSLVFRGQ